MTNIVGFLTDVSDPAQGNWTGSDVLSAEENALPKGTAFYMGGWTPHVRTLAQLEAQSARYRLPMWVYNPGEPGRAAGKAAGQAAANGAAGYGVPKGCVIGLDLETYADHDYSRAFRDAVVSAGFWYTPYGSYSTVMANYVGVVGYFCADWTNAIHIDPDCWATQYASAQMLGKRYDISAVASWAHIWDTQPPSIPEVKSVTVLMSDGTTQVLAA